MSKESKVIQHINKIGFLHRVAALLGLRARVSTMHTPGLAKACIGAIHELQDDLELQRQAVISQAEVIASLNDQLVKSKRQAAVRVETWLRRLTAVPSLKLTTILEDPTTAPNTRTPWAAQLTFDPTPEAAACTSPLMVYGCTSRDAALRKLLKVAVDTVVAGFPVNRGFRQALLSTLNHIPRVQASLNVNNAKDEEDTKPCD